MFSAVAKALATVAKALTTVAREQNFIPQHFLLVLGHTQ